MSKISFMKNSTSASRPSQPLTHFECTHQGILSVYLVALGIDYDIAS